MGLESMAAAGFAALGWQAARAGVNYVADAAGGALGMKVLNGTVNSFENVGGTAGRILGTAVAGQGLLEIKAQSDNISGTVKKLGGMVIDLAAGAAKNGKTSETTATQTIVSADGSIEEIATPEGEAGTSNFLSTAMDIGKVALPLMGAAAIATGFVPVAAVGLASAAATALPKIADSIMRTPVTGQDQDAVEEILVGGAKAFIKESAGLLVGNYVRANEVIKAYNGRIQQGADMGNAIGQYLPSSVGNYFVKTGEFLGTVDAGRVAMSDAVVSKAIQSGDTAETLVKTGMGIVDTVVTRHTSQPSTTSGWWDTARKAAWIGGGIVAAISLVAVAPEVAPFVAATSAISVADRVVTWAMGRIYPAEATALEQAPVAEKAQEEALEPQAEEKAEEKSDGLASRDFTVVHFTDSQIESAIAKATTAAAAA